MQKTVFLLCEGYLPLQLSFVYLFCKKGDFFGPLHRYTLQNDHFLFAFWDTNKYIDAKKDAE